VAPASYLKECPRGGSSAIFAPEVAYGIGGGRRPPTNPRIAFLCPHSKPVDWSFSGPQRDPIPLRCAQSAYSEKNERAPAAPVPCQPHQPRSDQKWMSRS